MKDAKWCVVSVIKSLKIVKNKLGCTYLIQSVEVLFWCEFYGKKKKKDKK